jgi:photosynthetic reaction center cytochrome c subunit
MNRIRVASLFACALLVSYVSSTNQEKGRSTDEEIQIPAGKENLPAEEVFKNIEILKGKPASRLPALMKTLNRLIGVECTHCHISGAWEKEEPEAKQMTRRMFQMVGTLSAKYFDDKAVITCWTCHRGNPKPSNGAAETQAAIGKLPSEKQRSIAEERLGPDKDTPSQQAFQNVRVFEDLPAKQLLRQMGSFNVALGVDCSHCHIADQYDDDDKAEKQTTREMVRMVSTINQQFFKGEAKVGCWTCHRGAIKPETISNSIN